MTLNPENTLTRWFTNSTKKIARSTVAACLFGAASLLMGGCTSSSAEPTPALPTPVPQVQPKLGKSKSALITNGGFESGDLSGWTVGLKANIGLAHLPPGSFSDLGLYGGGINLTTVESGAPGTQIPAGLTPDSTLRYPRRGQFAAVVNRGGNNNNTNTMTQTFTMTPADVDPADGKMHVRFTLAPILENPGHSATDQPYFFVVIQNLTKNRQLFTKFAYSNQPGVPWQMDPNSGVLYTDWQLFDVAPGPSDLDVGDQIELTVVAAGCALGGHYGHVYLDDFGAFIPGLTIAASAPAQANAGTNLTYTYLVENSGNGTGINVIVDQPMPAGTTFQSVNAPGASCSTPAVGTVGTVSCNFGTLAGNGHLTFQITVRINPTATGMVSNGSYSVRADNSSALLGPLVETLITQQAIYADLSISKTDNLSSVTVGQAVQYTISVANHGPSAVTNARVRDFLPAQLSSATWTCTAAGGGSCNTNTAAGDIDTTVNLPANATATFTLNATVTSGSANGVLTNVASVAAPSGVTDNDPSNNQDSDIDTFGSTGPSQYSVSVTKDAASTGSGTVVSSPVGISCDAACPGASAQYPAGTVVSITATPAPGSSFAGWSGACSGTVNPCTFTVNANTTLTAAFTAGSTTPSCFNVSLSDYTLFVLTDYTGGHDVEGKVAAGGNISMSDFSVGGRLADNNIANTLVAGGNLSLQRGAVFGDAWYGGSYSADTSVVYPRGTATQGSPINFAGRFASLQSLSSAFAQVAANGTTTRESWGGLFLSGSNPALNVFDLNASDLNGAVLFNLDAPAGSLAVVNVRGASASFSGFSINLGGGIGEQDVLFNFVNTTQINATGIGLRGTLLAPGANVSFSNGSWNGGIYARSMTGNAEGHLVPLNDRTVCP